VRVVDLPGIFALASHTLDEAVTRDFLLSRQAALVVNVLDASNLERNLYLTIQILEMGVPLIIALNMMDMAQAKGHNINIKALAQETGAPVVPMVASRNQGTDELLAEIVRISKNEEGAKSFKLYYGQEIENEITSLEKVIADSPLARKYPPRWLAIKLLEEDEEVTKNFQEAGLV